jgi:hypothetical protein
MELMGIVGLLAFDEERVRLSAKREDFERDGLGADDLVHERLERDRDGPSFGVGKGDELGNGFIPAKSRSWSLSEYR